jgi:molybdenum transport protein
MSIAKTPAPSGCCTFPRSVTSRANICKEDPMMSAASRTELERLVADDTPYGDLTTCVLDIASVPGQMEFCARGAMIVAETESAAGILEIAGCRVKLAAVSGTALSPGACILVAHGPAGALHRGWKVAQTLIEIWSGVATAAREIVDAVGAVSPGVAVACTRKSVPGTKSFAIRAVRAGGAVMHRLGLSETILVFPEHRVFLTEPLPETVKRLRHRAPEKKLVIEVKSIDDAMAAMDAGFDVIQAEKFSPQQIAALSERLRGHVKPGTARPLIAAAGGVNAGNAAAYARAGADIIVTSAPFFARPCDVQVNLTTAGAAVNSTSQPVTFSA